MPTIPNDPNKPKGKQDYQGNHDIYEMPEDLKPKEQLVPPQLPIGKIALVVVGIGVVIAIVLVCISIAQQSGSFL